MGFVPGLVVAFCGVLLSAALPPSTLWPLTLALVPLFVMVAGSKRPRQAFWLGVVFGATFFSLYILWLPSSFSELLGSFFWVLFPPLVAVLAGFWGLVCWSSRAIGGRGAGTLWLLPAFWVLMEWARTQGYLGFPWGTLGYAWLDTPVAQLADSIGTYGLSLLSTVLVALVAAALSPYTDASPERSGKLTRTLGLLLVATALGVGSWIVGLSKLDRPVAEATRTALLVQGNGDPFGRAVSAVAELDVYTQLTREGTGHLSPPPSYVIWPEGAVLGNTLDGRAGEATRQIVQKSAAGLTLIVGSRAFEAGKSFNSAYSLSGGQVFDRYDKRFLVPFGERSATPGWILLLPSSPTASAPTD
jgi:apolipoprotein N-acyltransferase